MVHVLHCNVFGYNNVWVNCCLIKPSYATLVAAVGYFDILENDFTRCFYFTGFHPGSNRLCTLLSSLRMMLVAECISYSYRTFTMCMNGTSYCLMGSLHSTCSQSPSAVHFYITFAASKSMMWLTQWVPQVEEVIQNFIRQVGQQEQLKQDGAFILRYWCL